MFDALMLVSPLELIQKSLVGVSDGIGALLRLAGTTREQFAR